MYYCNYQNINSTLWFTGGDDIVFDRAEWEEVVDYFSAARPDSELPERLSAGDMSPPSGRRGGGTGPAMVNYVDFIEAVLDSSQLKDIKTRLMGRTDTDGSGGSRLHNRNPHPIKGSQSTRGATVSFTSPDLFFGLDPSPARNQASKKGPASNSSSKLRKTIGGRYHSSGAGSGMYSPVVGGSDAGRRGPSPAGRSSFGSSKQSTSRDNAFMPSQAEDVKLTQKQFARAKQMKFGNQELRALEDLKVSVSEALDKKPIPKGKTKSDVLRDWLDMEDANRNGSLSKNSVIATLNALGLPYESWSTPSQRNLVDFLATRGGGTVMIDDIMALIGAKL